MSETLMTIKEIADRLGVPESNIRYYRDKYECFLPFVGKGRKRRYRPEAVGVFERIIQAVHEQHSPEQIASALRGESAAARPVQQPSELSRLESVLGNHLREQVRALTRLTEILGSAEEIRARREQDAFALKELREGFARLSDRTARLETALSESATATAPPPSAPLTENILPMVDRGMSRLQAQIDTLRADLETVGRRRDEEADMLRELSANHAAGIGRTVDEAVAPLRESISHADHQAAAAQEAALRAVDTLGGRIEALEQRLAARSEELPILQEDIGARIAALEERRQPEAPFVDTDALEHRVSELEKNLSAVHATLFDAGYVGSDLASPGLDSREMERRLVQLEELPARIAVCRDNVEKLAEALHAFESKRNATSDRHDAEIEELKKYVKTCWLAIRRIADHRRGDAPRPEKDSGP